MKPRLNLVLASGAVVLAVAPNSTPIPAARVVTVVGPAHPLSAPNVGIPCDELVFTRC